MRHFGHPVLPVMSLEQGDASDVLSCMSLFTKEPLITGLFGGK